MFTRLLIANRGEIAVRVIRACREMGIEAIAVYSDADVRSRHVLLADRAIRIGPAPAAESYLSIERVVEAAQEAGAEAIHPGYGFLSENAAFADACGQAGITFIGPPPAAMTRMGSKVSARRVAAGAGARVVPGETPTDQSDTAIAAAARRVGLPLLIKPSEGGGGIGMKAVRDEARLSEAIAQARREARAAFGDGTLYVERLLEQPRHVEVQILADRHGGVVHLFERECSVQRRHQKVIEEAPSPAVTPALRQRMGDTAVAIARAAGYEGAGTVEFLLEGAGDAASFYFLEMNARLQVEHPVTETLTGVDLVRAQLTVAAGDPLPWAQAALTARGHAIELRIYAEDPARGDLPQAGRLLLYREPSLPGIRIDSAVTEGDDISVHYDPLVAKLIASGETREVARRRAIEALRQFPVLGIQTNIPLLVELLQHPRFIVGEVDTGFLDRERPALTARLIGPAPPHVAFIAAAARDACRTARITSEASTESRDPWLTLRGARL
jgi:acetyl-CoA carboxylase biotin carboxylase subunit